MSVLSRGVVVAATVALSFALAAPVGAETISGAMAKAYRNNSTLNAARAGIRVTNETVPIAKSGMRPTIGAVGTLNHQEQSGTGLTTGSFGVSIRQAIFDGFQTQNNVLAAEARVRAARESLRNTEQNILFNAASAYMDVLSDRRIAALREQSLEFLSEQVRAANSRFEVGEGTRTDVAQAQASRSQAAAEVSAARAQANASAAVYRQIVGDVPGNLQMPSPVRASLPPNIDQAFAIALNEHPAIRATLHFVDAAIHSVKSAEGTMLPQLSAEAGVSASFRETHGGLPGVGMNDGTSAQANIGARLDIPIYSGGLRSAQVRQSKETLGEARIQVDVRRDEVRQLLTAAWTQFSAGQELVSALREVVSARQLALNGVMEERNVGQRTTLDVLNAQADVIEAQSRLVTAERSVIVASYAILSAAGRLSVERLGLQVERHRPEEHYDAVKDKWYGTTTPDGR